jgi:aminoglycoside 6'-N-acetyltransferase I
LIIRRAGAADLPIWARMLAALHEDASVADWTAELETLKQLSEPYIGFLAFTDEGEPIGMIDARVRNYAEGAPELHAPYVEDLWVDPSHRRSGVGRRLLEAVEAWAVEQGFDWLGSDARLDNDESHQWHRSIGFEETERLVVFGKPLAPMERTSTSG